MFKKILWACWFLGKNLAFKDPLSLKFHNRTDTNVYMHLQDVSHWRVHSKLALTGRRMDDFSELWWLVVSGGLFIWVSKISRFYTESFFFKYQNKAEFKNLNDTEVFSSDFPGLTISVTSTPLTTSMASMTFTASFHQKHYWFWLLIISGT